jgi:probable phosphoglycerate mutase
MEFITIKGIYDDPSCTYLIQFDGGAVPNPGTCGSGAVLFDPTGKCVWEVGEYSAWGTNNTAEYRGLELGLLLALEKGVKSLKVEGDSNLVIQQIAGKWQVKNSGLKDVFVRVSALIQKFDTVLVRHVYREFNTRADAITDELQITKTPFSRAATS